jgi:hypothetical protein
MNNWCDLTIFEEWGFDCLKILRMEKEPVCGFADGLRDSRSINNEWSDDGVDAISTNDDIGA